MKWKVLYGDWSEYSSDHYEWKDLPYDNVQIVYIIFDNGNKIRSSGVDKYVVQTVEKDGVQGLKLTYWKDENPEEGDPYYGKGRSRTFWPDESCADDTGYINIEELTKNIPPDYIKRGKYLDIETAKQMKIL